jgi:uncharacterized repeat protein (TIGR01451 family)
LIWQENFENGTGSNPVTLVSGYTGLGGTTYTASAAWADPDLCNGIVLNGQSSGDYQLCAANPAMDNLRLLAGYIGQHNGDYTADDSVQNHVVAAYTNETPGRQPPEVLAQTSQAVTLNPSAQQNRFITASVWVAATNCRLDEKDPMLRFQWSSDGSAWNDFGASIDVCRLPSIAPYPDGTDGPTVVTQAFANGGNLQGITTTSLFVRVINTNVIDAGTDMAWDNLAIYEGTPQLTKEFVDPYIDFGPGPDGNGYFDWSTLTFRITNSADLSAKTGIGFTDNLPAGMTIDDPVYTAVNCPTGTVSAVAGGTSIAVSGVSLPYGGEDPTLSSCTIEVDVIGTPSAIYTNDDTNNIRSPLGILPNTSATLTVVDGAPTGAAATDDALSGPYNQPLSFTPLTNDSAGTPASPYTASSFDMGGMRLCDVDPDETPPNCTQTLVFTDDGDYELNPGTGAVVFTPAPGFTGVARPIRYQVPVDYSFSYGPNPNDVADHAEVFDALIEPTIGPPPAPAPSETPSLNLVKTANPITFGPAGDRITYTTVTTNTGDVTLTNVTVRDPLIPGATCTPSVPVASLAVGASIRCTGTYTVSEADAAAGVVNNTARAVGTSPAGRSITASGTAKVPGPKPAPVLSLTKIPTPSKFAATGDTITYRIVATNTGVVPVTNAVVSDPQLTGLTCSPALPVATLEVGASITCSGTHAVTNAERAANVVKNTARVTGVGPDGSLATATGTAHVPGPDASTPLTLVKLADKGAFTGAGDRIGYTLRATNTGTAAITNATITDPKLGPLSCTPATPVASLAAGASITCTGSYTATANDASAGVINNTATATGVGPQGQSLSVADAATVPAAGNRPAITLVKSPQPAAFTTVGQTVTYSLHATNTGSVPLTGARVEDPMLSGLSCTPATPVASLPVGGTIRCTGTYAVTAADLRQGVIDNTAITTGVSPSGAVVTGNATTRVIGPDPVPSLLLLKSTDSKVFRAAGESIAYKLTAINTGTSTLTNARVTDPQIPNLSCVPSVPVASLAPGASITCTGSHVVTAAEASAGQVDNVARAVGTGPNGQLANATGTRSIPAEKPALTVVKTPSPATFSAAKDKVTYTIVTTNSGDVPLSDVRINDPLLSSVSCSPAQPASLAVGASMRCTGTHAVTAA